MIDIIYLILLALINSFVIIGFYEATQYEKEKQTTVNPVTLSLEIKEVYKYKMVLWFVRYYGDKIFSNFWSKPLYACPTCMASIHSLYVYWFFITYSTHNLVMYFIYILILAGMVTFINDIRSPKYIHESKE